MPQRRTGGLRRLIAEHERRGVAGKDPEREEHERAERDDHHCRARGAGDEGPGGAAQPGGRRRGAHPPPPVSDAPASRGGGVEGGGKLASPGSQYSLAVGVPSGAVSGGTEQIRSECEPCSTT